jgi:hypothetical protein
MMGYEQNPRSLRRNSHQKERPNRHVCVPRLRFFSPHIFQELLMMPSWRRCLSSSSSRPASNVVGGITLALGEGISYKEPYNVGDMSISDWV